MLRFSTDYRVLRFVLTLAAGLAAPPANAGPTVREEMVNGYRVILGIGERNRLFLHPLCGRPGRDPGAGSIEGYANLTSASFWPAPRRELVIGSRPHNPSQLHKIGYALGWNAYGTGRLYLTQLLVLK